MKTSTTSCTANRNEQICSTVFNGAAKANAPQSVSLLFGRAKQCLSILAIALILIFGFVRQGFSQATQTFNTNGTFTVPVGVTSVTVECWGGGGAGGGVSGSNGQTRAGGGGSGGTYTKVTSVSVNPGDIITVTVGAGGSGASAADGGSGTASTFASAIPVSAAGGAGGKVGNATSANGAGGGISTGITFNGGAGAAASGSSGAGGGGAGSAGSGGDASGTTGGTGGSGGGGAGAAGLSSSNTGNGNAAAALSGGGSGGRSTSSTSRTGGGGFRGQVIVTYPCPIFTLTSPAAATSICGSGTSTVTLNSSVANLPNGSYTVTYDLSGANTATGSTATMTVTSGVGTFTVPSAALTNQGTTTVTVTNLLSGSCTNTISNDGNNTATIAINPIPAAPTAIGGSRCGTGSVAISVTDPGSPLTVDWYSGNTGGSVLTGGTGVITFNTPSITNTTTYYAQTRNTLTNCISATRTAVVATINSNPTSRTVGGSTTICEGSGTNVTLNNSSTSTSYQLRNNADNTPIGSPVTGTGSALNLPTGPLTSTTVINVLATITATGCTAQMNGTATVTVNPKPTSTAGGSQTICVNETATVTGASASNGTIQWTSNGAGTIGGATTTGPTYTPAPGDAGKTITLTMTVSNSPCTPATDTYTITVNGPLQPGVISGPTSPSQGTSQTYSVANVSGVTYNWSFPSDWTFGGSNSNSVTVTVGAISGNISVTPVTCGPGLASTLAVTPVPVSSDVTITPTSTSVCIGGSIGLTALPSTLPSSSITAGTNDFNGTVTYVSAGSGTGTAWTKRTSPFTPTLWSTAFSSPDNSGFMLTNVAGLLITLSETSTLTSTVINTNNFSTLNLAYQHTFSSGTSSSATVEISTNGGTNWTVVKSYTTTTAGAPAFVSDNVDLTSYINQSNLKIRFNAVMSAANGIYAWWGLDNVTLNGTPVPLFSWSANPSQSGGLPANAGTPLATNNSISVNPTATTAYTLTLKNPATSTLTNSSPLTITVNPLPVVTLSHFGPLCFDATAVQLDGSPLGGTYSGLGVSPTGLFTPSLAGAGDHLITYSYTDENGCSASAQTTITVNALPTVSVSSPTVCEGTLATITATPTPAGSYNYAWTVPSGASDPGNVASFSSAIAGTYSVVITSTTTNCSSTSESGTVTVNPTSVGGTAGSDQAICSGLSPADITLVGNTGTIQWQYSTDNNTFYNISGATATTLTSAQMGTLTTTTYYRAAVTSGVCTTVNSNPVMITVNPLPDQPVAMNSGPFCAGTDIQLSVSNPISGMVYSWSGPGGWTASGPNPTRTGATIAMGGIYSVTATDANTCTSTAGTTSVTVNPLPDAKATGQVFTDGSINPLSTNKVTICQTLDLQLNASGGTDYSWTGPGFPSAVTGADQVIHTIDIPASGQYTVTVTTLGCSSTATVDVTVAANPDQTASINSPVCEGADLILTASGGDDYLWTGPNSYTSGTITDPVTTRSKATPDMSGIYSVVINNHACGSNTIVFDGLNGDPAEAVVNPMPAPPVTTDVTVNYDGSPHTATATVPTGIDIDWFTDATGNTPSAAPSGTEHGIYTAWAQARNAGTGCINPSRTLVTLTINPRPITITVLQLPTTNITKSCGDKDPTSFLYDVTGDGLANGNTIVGDIQRAPGEGIDSYAFNMDNMHIFNGLINNDANYIVTFNGGFFTITDLVAPTITQPSDIFVDADGGQCYASITVAIPEAKDNCGVSGPTGSRDDLKTMSDPYPVGKTVITWNVTDNNGNPAIPVIQNIFVTDKQIPVLTAPLDIVQSTDPGICTATVTIVPATAKDNCGVGTIIGTRGDNMALTDPYPFGTTTITWNAKDIHGNDALAVTQSVIINDDEKPVITASADINKFVDNGVCGAGVTIDQATAKDNCGVTDLPAGVRNDGKLLTDTYPVGTTEITWNVKDIHGNSALPVVQKVTITDNVPPVVLTKNITVQIPVSGTITILPGDVDGGSSDPCGIKSMSLSPNTFACGDVGDHTVTLTVTDNNNNTAFATATVTVQDNIVQAIAKDITIQLDASGLASITAAQVDNGSSGACGLASMSVSPNTFDCTNVGKVNTVTLTVTNNHGVSSTATANVTVQDKIAPTVFAHTLTIYLDATGHKSIDWTDLNDGSFDNCAIVSYGLSQHTFDCSNVGDNTVFFFASDKSLNSSVITTTVTVVDNIPPVITCPGDITMTADAGKCGAVVTFAATATDNCSAKITYSQDPGTLFLVGTTTVKATATDPGGNTAVCSFTITVTDNEKPVINNLPANIIQDNDVTNCSAVVSWTEPSATDNCDILTLTSDHASGETFPVGMTTVTYTATDIHGNAQTASFTVTVNDTEKPKITGMPSDIAKNSDAGSCSTTATWAAPAATDNCGVPTFTSDHASGDVFPVGVTTVTYTATDIHGNVTTASFTVTVTDAEMPVIKGMPDNISQNNDKGACGAVVTWTAPTASDNCGILSLTSDHKSGDTFPVGTTTVTYTATDIHTNVTTASFTVTVTDNEKPVINNLPANIIQDNDVTNCSAVVSWTEPSATDNCDILTLTSDHASGETFPVGMTTVTYTATDIHGNAQTASFTVTVNDTEKPKIAGMPSDIAKNSDAGSCSTTATWAAPAATDNCGVLTFTSDHASGDVFPVGVTTVTYTATDIHGNVTTASFTVTVTDAEMPVIKGMPDNISQNNDKGACGAVVTWTAPTASDNCGILSLTSDHKSGDTFPVGTTTVTYTATDIHTNVTTASFTVTVTDNEKPVINNLPANIIQDNDVTNCSAVVSWTEPSATDNCDILTLTSDHASGETFPVGMTTVTYTATDIHGNAQTASFTVTVNDTEKPKIAGMPSDIAKNSDAGSCSTTATWAAPAATDNCGVLTFTSDHASGDVFPVGVTTVTYTATDIHGNVTTASFTVTVTDAEMPVIKGMPDNISQNNDKGACGAVVTWTAPTASDNCGILSLTSDHKSGDTFPVGTTTVTYTATDIHTNITTASFTVTITDTEIPVITTNGNKDVNSDLGVCGATVSVSAGATDNCSVGTPTGVRSDGLALNALFPVGTTTIKWNVDDAHGNHAAEATQIVLVTDNQKPVITTNGDQYVATDHNVCGATVAVSAGATDNCVVDTPTGVRSDGLLLTALYPVGTTTIKWNVKDANGNAADEVIQKVVVTDNQNPVITCPANISVNNDQGNCGAVVTFIATATDNCSAEVTYSQNSGTLFPVGTTTVIATATDPSGNKSTCSFTVTVKDTQIPVITTNGDKNVNTDLNVCGATVLVSATAADNCSVATPTGIRSDGLALNALFPVGVTTIKWDVNDANGNSASEVIQTVTVTDNQLPNVIVKNITIQLDATGNATIAPTDINNGSTDNCGIQSMVLSKTTFTSADVLTSPNAVTLTVTDIHGNVGSAVANVTVASIKINVTADAQTKVYGDPDPSLTYKFTPALLGGDSFSGNLTRDPGVKVGSYAINQGTLALKGYYTIIYQGANLTITQRPITATADAVSKEFGSADPAFTYKVTSGNLISPDAFTGSLVCTHTEQPGTYPILQGTLALSTNYLLTYVGADFTIKAKTVGPAVTVSPSVVQYSDQVTFTATITMGAPLLSGRLHPVANVTFKIGSQEMGTVQLKVNGLDLVGKLTTTLLEKVRGQLAPGNKTVYAVFDFPDSKIKVNPNPVMTNLTITPEDARANITGLFIESTSEDFHKFGNDNDNQISLKATIQDISAIRNDHDYDPYAGDIRNAKVRFLKGSVAISPWLTPDLVNGRDSKTGTVNFQWVYDNASKNLPNDINIEVGGNGYYVRNNPADMSIATLYSPTGNYIAGGGFLMNPYNTSGVYAGTPGLNTNFGFVVKFLDKGKNPGGNIQFIIRKADDGGIHTYLVESTSITSVGVTNHTHHATISSVIAKANLTDITNTGAPVILGSNLKLLINLTDNSETGSSDQIGITLWNGGSLYFSSSWTGISTSQRIVSAGSIIIHSGYSFGDTFNAVDNTNDEFMRTPELGVKAYPNPFTDHVYFDLQLNTDSKVRLEIFDVTGAKIATVFNDAVIAYNHYLLEYAPEKLSSNMLMYKLVVDDKIVFTGKLIHK